MILTMEMFHITYHINLIQINKINLDFIIKNNEKIIFSKYI